MSLPPFPVDDLTLDALERALTATTDFDEDRNPIITGADYDIHTLMSFLSGYDPTKVVDLGEGVTEYVGGCIYTEHCVITALVAEVRRLRAELGLVTCPD